MSKYGNKPVEIDGHKFHSMLEGSFYQKCLAWQKAGKIGVIQMQVPYKLFSNGVLICTYKLDFLLVVDGKHVPVEVKGFWTAVAKLKRKLFEAQHGPLAIHTREKPWTP